MQKCVRTECTWLNYTSYLLDNSIKKKKMPGQSLAPLSSPFIMVYLLGHTRLTLLYVRYDFADSLVNSVSTALYLCWVTFLSTLPFVILLPDHSLSPFYFALKFTLRFARLQVNSVTHRSWSLAGSIP